MGLTSVSPGNTGCSSDCLVPAELTQLRTGCGWACQSTKRHLAHAPQRPSAVCPFPWLRSPSAWKTKKMKLKSLLLRYYPPGTEFPEPAGSGFPAWDSLGQRRGREPGEEHRAPTAVLHGTGSQSSPVWVPNPFTS